MGNTMKIAARVIGMVGRGVRSFVFMTWEPIPFFGLALTSMLLFWVYLAIAR
jgi:hypothetical protein